jgi:hypothetical protein
MHRASRRYPVCLTSNCIAEILDPRVSQFCPACQEARAAKAAETARRGHRKALIANVTTTTGNITYAPVTLQAEPWKREART